MPRIDAVSAPTGGSSAVAYEIRPPENFPENLKKLLIPGTAIL
jgi:hypothetical protein